MSKSDSSLFIPFCLRMPVTRPTPINLGRLCKQHQPVLTRSSGRLVVLDTSCLQTVCKPNLSLRIVRFWVSFLRLCSSVSTNRLDLEVQAGQTENQRLEVLNQIVEHPQPLWVSRLGDVDQGSDFGCLEGDVLRTHSDFELLPSILVLLRPFAVIFPGAV